MARRNNSKLSPEAKADMLRDIRKLITRRHNAIPFPLPMTNDGDSEFIMSTLDPDTRGAIIHLQTFCHTALLTAYACEIDVDGTKLTVHSNVRVPKIAYTLHEDHPAFAEVNAWVADMRDIKIKCDAAFTLADYVIDKCSTAGQIARVWPEIVKFLPELQREALGERVRASQMPRDIDMIYVNKHRDAATHTITLMSLIDSSKYTSITLQ